MFIKNGGMFTTKYVIWTLSTFAVMFHGATFVKLKFMKTNR